MIITKEALIQAIARNKNLQAALVKNVICALEEQVITTLASASPTEEITLKIWNGLYIHCRYEDEKRISKGFFQNRTLHPQLRLKTEATRSFCNKVNDVYERNLNL